MDGDLAVQLNPYAPQRSLAADFCATLNRTTSLSDTGLLSMHPELVAALADVGRSELVADEHWDDVDQAGKRLLDVCWAIIRAAPAQTPAGWALKAASAMHQLRYSFTLGEWPGTGEAMAWSVLSQLAGDVYVPPAMPAHITTNSEPGRDVVGTGSVSLGHPDAYLIQLCDEFIENEVAFRAVYDGPGAISDDDAAEAAAMTFGARENALLDQMEALQAVTAEGVSARARVLAAHNRDFGFSFDHQETMAGRLLSYLMRDAADLGGAPGRCVDSTDAALIAIGTEARSLNADYDRLSDELRSLVPGSSDHERKASESDAPHDRFFELSDQAVGLRASGLEGWQAKALVMRHFLIVECEYDGKMKFNHSLEELAWSLVCDLTAGRV